MIILYNGDYFCKKKTTIIKTLTITINAKSFFFRKRLKKELYSNLKIPKNHTLPGDSTLDLNGSARSTPPETTKLHAYINHYNHDA